MILDATAGNRHIWCKNKHPEGVIFMDKEPGLKIPPDVIATWDKIPFPDNYFDCIIFDPPHQTSMGKPCQWARDPTERNGFSWYGQFGTNSEIKREIYKAQKEFARVSSRLCLKWYDDEIEIHRFLTLFDKWRPVFIQEYIANTKKKRRKASQTYWVKMIRRDSVIYPIGDK